MKILVYLGKISFSVYLCNYTVEIFTAMLNEQLGWNINFSGGKFFVGNIVVQILIASVMYYFFEKRMSERLRKKDREEIKCTS